MTQPAVSQPQPPAEPSNTALLALEAAFAAEVLSAFAAWAAAAAAAILAPVAFGLMPNPAALWSTLPLWNRQVEGLLRDLENIARRGWEDAARQLGVRLPFDVSDPLVQQQLSRTRNLMVRIPDEIYRSIIKDLDAGVAAGEDAGRLAARVNKILTVTGSENWASRARTVAATEVHRAYNFGSFAAAQRVDAQDPRMLFKRWDSRDDTKTRRAHELADGQQRPVNQPFIVDFEPLMTPADPYGSPSNVINCRCKMQYSWRTSGR